MSIQETVWIKMCCREKEKGRKRPQDPDLASEVESVSQITV